MSNTVNVTSDILAQKALEGFVNVLAPLNAFSTNYSPAPAEKGATVSVPLYGKISQADNFGGDYTVNSDQTINEVAVSLSTHFYKTINVSDSDAAKGVDSAKLAYQAGAAVAYSVFTGALGTLNLTCTPQGIPSQVCNNGSSQFNTTGVLAMRTAAAGWGEKNLIIDSAYYSSLLGALPSNTTVQNEATSNGSLGKLYGFSLYETDVSPMCAGFTSGKAIAANPSALAIASRYLQPDDGGTYMDARAITDPKTNATLGMRTFYDTKAGKKYVTFEWLGGYTKGVSGACAFVAGT